MRYASLCYYFFLGWKSGRIDTAFLLRNGTSCMLFLRDIKENIKYRNTTNRDMYAMALKIAIIVIASL